MTNSSIVAGYHSDYTAQDFLRGLQSAPFTQHEEIMATVCITHCRKDFTRNLDLEDDVLSSYTFRYWGVHLKVMGAIPMRQRLDFVLELCQERQLGDPDFKRHGFDHEYNSNPANPNPDDGLRAGYNACLMVIFLNLMDLYPHVEHLHKPSTICQLNALHLAARAGNDPAVNLLMDEHTLPSLSTILNGRDFKDRTPLMLACRYGYASIVRQLLSCVSNDTASVGGSGTQGHLNATEVLFNHPAVDLHAANAEEVGGNTALHLAAGEGHSDIVKLLLAHPGKPPLNPNVTNSNGMTPLHKAVMYERLNVVQVLLNHPTQPPVDVNAGDSDGVTVLHYACRARDFDIINALLAHPSNPPLNPNIADNGGNTALHEAAKRGDRDVVQVLLNDATTFPVNLNARNNLGWTALHFVSSKGHFAMDNLGWNKAARVFSTQHIDIVKLLLSHPTKSPLNLNAATNEGYTALHLASHSGDVDIVQALLDHPTQPPLDLNALDSDGWNALHFASHKRHFEIVNLLLAHQSNPPLNLNAATNEGYTALHLASRSGYLDIVRALLDYPTHHPVDLNATDSDGWTVLHHASNYGHIDVVKELLGRGAALNALTSAGETPLMLASQNKCECEARERMHATESYLQSLYNVIELESYSDPDFNDSIDYDHNGFFWYCFSH